MNRHTITDALVLHSHLIGEDNRSITLFSPEKGIFQAIQYGGRKSKLKSLVSQFHTGKIYLYSDEVKHSIKITDMDVHSFRTEIRENLYKTCAASFTSEIIIKTQAAGEYKKTWTLINGFLDGLCIATEEECKVALLRFIWRYLGISGIQIDTSTCGICDKKFFLDMSEPTELYFYNPIESFFVCNDCCSQQNELRKNGFSISKEALFYLYAIETLTPHEVRKIPLRYTSTQQLHDLLFYLLTNSINEKLKTLEASNGIL